MSDTAIFTDSNDDRVILVHYMPSQLPQERLDQATDVVQKADIPEPPATAENEVAVMYYNTTDGFSYVIETRDTTE